ncbi:MAG: signal peptidase I [Eggerthellaceae bacterium]|nr:signal peptidase I [Eggerthellaceae bacterium]
MSLQEKLKSGFCSFLGFMIFAICIFGCAFLLREYVVGGYQIPTGSMEETIQVGDMVFAEKLFYKASGIKQEEIVTFYDNEIGNILIKRCVATAGQTVDLKNGKFYVDGVEQDKPYTNGKPTYPLKNSKISFPFVVPENSIFCLGDNRTNSKDSRYFGAVSLSNVEGHAFFRYWPLNSIGLLN